MFIDKIDDEELINILKFLGKNWNVLLLNKNAYFGAKYYKKEKKDIANEISTLVKKANMEDENTITAISRLSEWFEVQNPKECQELFGKPISKGLNSL